MQAAARMPRSCCQSLAMSPNTHQAMCEPRATTGSHQQPPARNAASAALMGASPKCAAGWLVWNTPNSINCRKGMSPKTAKLSVLQAVPHASHFAGKRCSKCRTLWPNGATSSFHNTASITPQRMELKNMNTVLIITIAHGMRSISTGWYSPPISSCVLPHYMCVQLTGWCSKACHRPLAKLQN